MVLFVPSFALFLMTTPVLRWFEGPIYGYINKRNEASMRGAAAWLARGGKGNWALLLTLLTF